MKNDAKQAARDVILQIIDFKPNTPAKAQQIILSIGAKAAVKYLHYRSMKALYKWRKNH
jgi:hypothetical protein